MQSQIYNQPKYYELAFSFVDTERQVKLFEKFIKKYSKIKVKKVLAHSLAYGSLTPAAPERLGARRLLAVYDRAGEPCLRCAAGVIELSEINAEKTFFCPRCQTKSSPPPKQRD